MLRFGPGEVVSEGTLLNADLILAFTGALDHNQSVMVMSQDLRDGRSILNNWKRDRINYPKTDSDAETIGGIIEGLLDELNGLAPEGCYFGSHEDDGALYGFWELEEQ